MAPRNAEGQPEAEPLIGTKLHAPPSRNDLVTRSDLVELLRAGSHRQLTLLSAPAGYGKTTLLAEWRAEIELVVALTVLLSALLHGVTATLLSAA
jgi:ATP/maltotriose-dependent transcriptional regulator MalT